jgi:hypothetical protein
MDKLKSLGLMAALVLLGACARHAALPPPVDLAQTDQAPAPLPPQRPEPPPAKVEPPPVIALTPGDLSRIAALVPAELRGTLSDSSADGLARLVERTLETGPSGRAVPWALDQSSGTMMPKPLRRTPLAAQCRDIVFANGGQTLNVTACKGTDGHWALKP